MFAGVWRQGGQWVAGLRLGQDEVHTVIGTYHTQHDAAKAYDRYVRPWGGKIDVGTDPVFAQSKRWALIAVSTGNLLAMVLRLISSCVPFCLSCV